MVEPHLPSLPFVTRDMLKYGNADFFGLRVTHFATSANIFKVVVITRNGVVEQEITSIAADGPGVFTVGLDDFPIYVGVADHENSYGQGELYVQVSLEYRGAEAIGLCNGYVYRDKVLTYPAINDADLIPGRGKLTSTGFLNPATGAEASVSVPVGQMWLVHGMTVRLVTDANAANRRVHFKVGGSSTMFWETFADIDQTASTTRDYIVAPFGTLPDREDGTTILVPFPTNVWAETEATISTETENLQAGDDFTSFTAFVEKFPHS